jgi:type I restriction enzyme, R subunit
MSGPAPFEPEWKTRRERIDPVLRSLGWIITPFKENIDTASLTHHAVTELETSNGPADYTFFVDGQPLGIVEAKKVTLGPQNVLTQAERYSCGLATSPFDFRGFRVPFLYSTNGEVFWFQDVRNPLNRSRQIVRFHTPAALAEMMARDFEGACQALLTAPNDHHWLRPYQKEANAAVEKAIADRKRQMLLAMATGTGKTFTLVNQVDSTGSFAVAIVPRRAYRTHGSFRDRQV